MKKEEIKEEEKVEEKVNYIKEIKKYVKNPLTYLKKENKITSDLKSSCIFGLLLALVASVLATFCKIFDIIHLDYEILNSNGNLTKWYFDNLENYSIFKIFGDNFLVYAGAIFVVAFVYYIASLIVKKEIKFEKTLGTVSLAVAPTYVLMLVASPIVSIFSVKVGILVSLVGVIYALISIVKVFNDEMKLDDKKYLIVNVIVIAVLVVCTYYAFLNIALGQVKDLFNMIG